VISCVEVFFVARCTCFLSSPRRRAGAAMGNEQSQVEQEQAAEDEEGESYYQSSILNASY
jgi:hypothetical protein